MDFDQAKLRYLPIFPPKKGFFLPNVWQMVRMEGLASPNCAHYTPKSARKLAPLGGRLSVRRTNMNLRYIIAIIVLISTNHLSFAESVPFDKYPPEEALTGKRAPVSMQLPKARKFRTVLRSSAAEGPDFNGTINWLHGFAAQTVSSGP